MSAFDQLLTIVEEQPLSRILPVALRIATSIADEELTSRIKLELLGYLADNPEMKEDTIVPEYRAFQVLDTMISAAFSRSTILIWHSSMSFGCGMAWPNLKASQPGINHW